MAIRVLVKFISIYAEKLGKERIIELEDNATVEDLLEKLTKEIETTGISIKPVVFVNYRFTKDKQVLRDGDEVLVMPPFAGG
ncbi:MAG: MoaD/ThiS family protein [Desulfurococcaceae archaeon]